MSHSAKYILLVGASCIVMSGMAQAQTQTSLPAPGTQPADDQGPTAAAVARQAASPGASSSALSDRTEVDEIVVTAQKRVQALNDVGITISAVGSEELAERGIRSSEDLAQVVSAFTVAESADGTPVYTLRGVGFNSPNLGAQPTVSVYVDEAALPYGPLTQGPLFDLQRVEVLKGPQGTLFGQNSTGGAINYIAAKPTDEFESAVQLSYGRFNMFQAEGYVSGPLSDQLSARLAVTGTRSDDWQYNYRRDDKIGQTERFAGRLLLDWEAAPTFKVSVNLNGWLDRSDNQIPQYLAPLPRVPSQAIPELFQIPSPPQSNRAADWDANRPFDRNNEFGQAVLRADWDLSDTLTVTSLSNYAHVSIDSIYDNDGTLYGFGYVTTSGHVEVFNQEVRLTADLGEGNIIVGGNYQTDNSYESSLQIFDRTSSTINVLSPPLPPPGLGSFTGNENRGKQKNESVAMFGNVEWNVTDSLTLLAGARYTWLRHRNEACSADPGNGEFAAVINQIIGLLSGGTPGNAQPGGCISIAEDLSVDMEQQSFTEDNISWRAGVNFKPNDDILLYGLISRGYKAGNYPVINASARSQFKPVKQEELTSYELGVKASLLDRMIQFNAAGYYYDYRDKQLLTNTVDPVFGLLTVLANVPKSRVYGFDVETTVTPTDGLTLRSSLAYANTRVGRFEGYDVFHNPVPLTGRAFNYSPKWTATGDAEYSWELSDTLGASIGADLTYNSATYADLAESPVLRIKPYTLIGLRAGISGPDDRWKLMAWVKNLTDEYHWTNVQPGYDTLFRITGAPRTYGVSLGYKF